MTTKTLPLLAALFFFMSIDAVHHSLAWAAGKPRVLMGSLGDSITAATFADLSASEPFLGPPDENGVRHPTDPSVPGVIFSVTNKATYSWASGEKIQSHFLRLKNALARQGFEGELRIQNEAIPGEKAVRLEQQAARLAEAMASGQYAALAYVTFFIGNNDACGETQEAAMRGQLREAFRTLASIPQKEPIRVLVSGLPRIPELGTAPIRQHRIPGSMTCEEVRREVFGSCKHLLNWKDPAEFEQRLEEVAAKNRLLEEAVQDAAARFSNLDLVFTNVLFEKSIPASWLAVDCFHPNQEGQSEISRLLWEAQPWY
ncbi:MAG: SGNH/GDSL hydrolase family protein [Oligoflexia bacterium]|nr:SGNH/GDSL hydrolase family protein [Oligoflexia bacterium]